MSRTASGGLLRGTVIRKGGASSSSSTRISTPQVQSTSTTIFGGGVKDPSGRTSEYFVSLIHAIHCMQIRPILESEVASLGKRMLPQDTFEDLGVEKEVAVRRRIAKEFNKRKEDFPDLRSYNDYLEEVEDITFNLINDIDIPETEARIAAYRRENAALIELNIQREEQYSRYLKEHEDAERQEREQRALELRRAEEEEREEREKERREIIDQLQTSDKDAVKLIAKSRAGALRRATARSSNGAQSSSKALRPRFAQSAVIPDEPHVPLQDDWYAYEDMFVLRDSYDDPASEAVRRDREGIMRAGGYRVEEAWERALRYAVAGLEIMPLQGFHLGANTSPHGSGESQAVSASTS
ncbi:predicted protein [Postia placenta Mad-698-R]|uniref:MAT1 centre domain-containing protein n=1 Tax=Postia placenta MAD-698-R-SB12 TaxID=670580 RepID=A0A1X6N9G0_9APHY|nr:hypothetical protein POSPLADRAFT_1044563 [Postia placenta MAD-698-R-SB12]EED79038.1 predicted protein [Postia placenta Mad-698-R]OSX65150.1 hypothetical protein POSPLADRAFT_1044563 [Postia placenta MAD-698-R-SB12]